MMSHTTTTAKNPAPNDAVATSPGDTARKQSPFDFAAWLIDLDGTLYRQRPVRLLMALEFAVWGLPTVAIIREFRREHERLHDVTLPAGTNPFEAQIERTAERLNLESDRVRKAVDAWMFVRPAKWLRLFRRRSLLSQIASFRDRGGRTALVSDYPARRKLAAMQVTDQFDVVIASGETGGPLQLKPSPAGYQLAASGLQVSPAECLVIGDRTDVDGEAARRANMRFWHVAAPWTA